MTLGWAQLLAPGEVVGIDLADDHLRLARDAAQKQAISNVRFEHASVYSLPFPDESFDAVFGHTILQHLNDPLVALGEMYRVLKPGSVIGVREEDQASAVIYPMSSAMERQLVAGERGRPTLGPSPTHDVE